MKLQITCNLVLGRRNAEHATYQPNHDAYEAYIYKKKHKNLVIFVKVSDRAE
jgi:hypothetical protein